ncbi:MAG: hypothetical protein JJU00_19240 [Opitutales bacterium]|nr:hypothetical protein [Opitutales bacterium]
MDRRRHSFVNNILRAEGEAHLTPFRCQTKWDMDYPPSRKRYGRTGGMEADTSWFTFGLVDYPPSLCGALHEDSAFCKSYGGTGGLRYEMEPWRNPAERSEGNERRASGGVGNPKHGRFINRDPIGEAGGLNLYEAFGGDPVNRWDLLGLSASGLSPIYDGGELEPFPVSGSNLGGLAAARFHLQNRARILSLRRDGMASMGAQHEYAPNYTGWSLNNRPRNRKRGADAANSDGSSDDVVYDNNGEPFELEDVVVEGKTDIASWISNHGNDWGRTLISPYSLKGGVDLAKGFGLSNSISRNLEGGVGSVDAILGAGAIMYAGIEGTIPLFSSDAEKQNLGLGAKLAAGLGLGISLDFDIGRQPLFSIGRHEIGIRTFTPTSVNFFLGGGVGGVLKLESPGPSTRLFGVLSDNEGNITPAKGWFSNPNP